MAKHEYTILGLTRTHLGRYLGLVAAFAGSLGASIMVLSLELFESFGFSESTTTYITIPLLTPTFYIIFHYLFDKFIWKQRFGKLIFGLPDLSGEWLCNGKKLGDEPVNWRGEIVITQHWEKIAIVLKTQHSTSESISASILRECDTGCGYRLMYTYRNRPQIGAANDMNSHTGYCELTFNNQLDRAEGLYFNNLGRISHGEMYIVKKKESQNV